ncbi:MAG: putative ABC transporter permease subunit [Acetivibrionales bacterium]|jgi:ABC-2 type transport system permease protein
MRKFISLLKLQINARYGVSNLLYNLKSDKKAFWKSIGMGFIILIALAEVIGMYTFIMLQLYRGAIMINAPQVVLTMAAVISGIIVLIFGIFYILSTVFLAKDTELLASLPLSQGNVFLSKFALVLLGEYPFAFFLMIPPVIIYGVGQKMGITYYVLSIICTLIIPLVPLVISALFSLFLMSIVSRSRNRDLITIIGSIILLVAVFLGQNYFISRMPENEQEFLMQLFKSSNAMVEYIGRAFPPAVWITKILSGTMSEALINMAYLIIVSVMAFGLVFFIASFIYQRGATAQLETGISTGKTKLSYKSLSQVLTIFKIEWLTLLRTPIYALNSLVMVFMAPLLIMLPMFGGNLANDPDLQFLYRLIENSESNPALILIVAGIIALFVLINPAVSSTFSREGKNIWILKNIPVKPEIQVFGKLLAGYSISFIAALLSAFMAILSFKISIISTIMIVILTSAALVPISAIGIYIDLMRPKLVWNNPQEAIKQNFNVVIAMLLGFLAVTILGVIGYIVVAFVHDSFAVFAIMLTIILLLSYLSVLVLKSAAKGAYRKIEG